MFLWITIASDKCQTKTIYKMCIRFNSSFPIQMCQRNNSSFVDWGVNAKCVQCSLYALTISKHTHTHLSSQRCQSTTILTSCINHFKLFALMLHLHWTRFPWLIRCVFSFAGYICRLVLFIYIFTLWTWTHCIHSHSLFLENFIKLRLSNNPAHQFYI